MGGKPFPAVDRDANSLDSYTISVAARRIPQGDTAFSPQLFCADENPQLPTVRPTFWNSLRSQ